jgi:hypothetical protein
LISYRADETGEPRTTELGKRGLPRLFFEIVSRRFAQSQADVSSDLQTLIAFLQCLTVYGDSKFCQALSSNRQNFHKKPQKPKEAQTFCKSGESLFFSSGKPWDPHLTGQSTSSGVSGRRKQKSEVRSQKPEFRSYGSKHFPLNIQASPML